MRHDERTTRWSTLVGCVVDCVAGCVAGGGMLATLALAQAGSAALLRAHAASDDPPPRVRPLPADRGGQESIGQHWPDLSFDRRLMVNADDALPDTERSTDVDDLPPVTLYRWWTNGCRFCTSSLPAIEQWRKRFASQGLRVVAVYHPKPPREVSDAFVRRAAEAIGYEGELAIDRDWSNFRRVTRQWQIRRATSISFLVDHEGVIRFVHPGPDFYPAREADAGANDGADDGADDRGVSPSTRQHRDHARLEAAIEALLHEREAAQAKRDDQADDQTGDQTGNQSGDEASER